MTLLLFALAVVVAVVVGGVVALAVRSKREYAAGNQVVPGTTSRAPASWAGSHSPEAKLHRRLRAAVLAAHAATDSGLGDARYVIEREAMAIDDRLIAAAALASPHQAPGIAAVEQAVAALEAAVASMGMAMGDVLGESSTNSTALDAAVTDVQTRLMTLQLARQELDQLDSQQILAPDVSDTPDISDIPDIRPADAPRPTAGDTPA